MLSYVNIFSKDIVKLSGFYRDVFGFEEILEIRSPIFVGLRTGQSCLGIQRSGRLRSPEAVRLCQPDRRQVPSQLRR